MKKIIIVAALVCAFFTTSCRETTTEKIEIEVSSDDIDGIFEHAAKEVDKEVNEEIDKEIDKIGNDY
jgi:Skp family chaperone for outer membrane proteins